MEQPTAQKVIDTIIDSFGVGQIGDTVDTIKIGDPDTPVTGIVTTFLATSAVIEQAAKLGANLIITHEPTFYNHLDQTDWLVNDAVYVGKRALLTRHGVVIWRCHDYWHARRPDGIIAGVLQDLGWEVYAHPERSFRCAIPPTTLGALVEHLKQSLGIDTVRVVGSATQICQNVGLLVGAVGGQWQISAMNKENLDTLIVGEINEWETSEYVRDAQAAGHAKALIILGHANSEEAGMRHLADYLRGLLPNMAIEHVPTGDPFRFI